MSQTIQAKKSVLTKLKISQNDLKSHQITPMNVIDAVSDQGPERVISRVRRPIVQPTTTLKKFDSTAFVEKFHALIKNKVIGYALQIRKNGNPNQTIIWNWSRTNPDGGKGWTLDSRMHVASVSKMITGIAMYKLLLSKGISLDASIENFLPTYWVKGPNVSKITFRNLLNHTSGFSTGDSKSDFLTMKTMVKNGVSTSGTVSLGKKKYANMNFGLCRILIPIMNFDITRGEDFSELASLGIGIDSLWDVFTISSYKEYVQENIFTPAGVQNAGFSPRPFVDSFAYPYNNPMAKGWDSGNLSSMSGGAGWRLSVNEVLQVMHHLRRKGSILSTSKAQELLENSLGLDWNVETPAGKWYSKNGRWTQNDKTEQCVAAFLPGGYELVVFVNSQIGSKPDSLTGLAYDTFLTCLK